MTVDVSIFIPVYKESNQLASMLNELNSQNVAKEIFVTVDAPTEEFSQKIKSLENENVKFIVNKERIGKANAVNEHSKVVFRPKCCFFLDSDIQISSDPDFLRKIIMETQHFRIA